MTTTLGVLRVLTTDDRQVLVSHGRLLESHYDVAAVTRCIPDQPQGVHDATSHRRAEPKIVETARLLEADGVDGIVLSCAADPALDEAREAVAVPVAGAGSACASMAVALGGPVGVLGITEEVPTAMADILGAVPHRRPLGVTDTTVLLEPSAAEEALAAAEMLVEDGAETIAFACTGYVTTGIAERIERELGVTTVDPVLAAGAVLRCAVR